MFHLALVDAGSGESCEVGAFELVYHAVDQVAVEAGVGQVRSESGVRERSDGGMLSDRDAAALGLD